MNRISWMIYVAILVAATIYCFHLGTVMNPRLDYMAVVPITLILEELRFGKSA